MAEAPGWVTVAVLRRARGIKGELLAVSETDDPDRFGSLSRVFLARPEASGLGREFEIERVWFHGSFPVFKFRGVETMSDAEPLAGHEVRLPLSERREARPGEFFLSDLVGCEVVERAGGSRVGTVSRWIDAGGPGLLEVRDGAGREYLIPFARAICVVIDPAAKRIEIDPPEGLLELNRS
ncbi:MAG: 16S rRNA processing protein RimM [Bryobacterales bacterium]|nr:16S rRNA processing protein RimM [Bryobacterales bacterium]